MNATRDVLVSGTYTDIQMKKWEDINLPATNLGWNELENENSYSTFIINIDLTFTAAGEEHRLNKEHTTEEPYINLFYSDNYFEWTI